VAEAAMARGGPAEAVAARWVEQATAEAGWVVGWAAGEAAGAVGVAAGRKNRVCNSRRGNGAHT
jgi:succinyl-CoA synthetase alpha subunit